MAIITLGDKNFLNKVNQKEEGKKYSPQEIKEAIKNMDNETKKQYLNFLLSKAQEEKEKIISSITAFNETVESTVLAKGTGIDIERMEESFNAVFNLLNSDFSDIYDYAIETLKKERNKLIKELSLAYYNDFKKSVNK